MYYSQRTSDKSTAQRPGRSAPPAARRFHGGPERLRRPTFSCCHSGPSTPPFAPFKALLAGFGAAGLIRLEPWSYTPCP